MPFFSVVVIQMYIFVQKIKYLELKYNNYEENYPNALLNNDLEPFHTRAAYIS